MPHLDTPARGVGGALSGRIGSTIYARGPHGPYAYEFASRTDPNTTRQQSLRTWFTTAANIWKLFTHETRTGWETYAENVAKNTILGRPNRCTGFNRFVGTYVFATQTYVSMTANAPTVFTLGRLGVPLFFPWAGVYILLAFDPTDDWIHDSNAGFSLYCSPPQPDTVNYYRGPYRWAGNALAPISGPPYFALFIPPWVPWNRPTNLFVRMRAIEADNRLSSSLYARFHFPVP